MSGISLTIAISIGYIALAYIRIYEVQTWILSSVITVIGVFLLFIISVQIEQHQCEKKLWMLFGDYGMDIYMIGYYVQQAIYVIVGKILGCNYLIYAWLMLILGLIVPVILSKYIVRKNRVLLMLVLGRKKMNYLISAYSVNPYHGSEDGVGWNWVLQYEKNFNPGDRIILLTKKYNEKDTRKGMKEFGIKHIELVIADVPNILNWFREKHSIFHHMYYILWQHWAWLWVKKSGIKFDIIHHVTMGDYRITGEMYKCKDARVIFGPVGGAQITPKSLKTYEKNKIVAKIREIVNKSCDINPFYREKINSFSSVVASNGETYQQIAAIRGESRTKQIVELGLTDEYINRSIKERTKKKIKILYMGRLIEKKGILFLLDVVKQLKNKIEFEIDICGNGYLFDEIKHVLEEYSLDECVNMHGEIPHNQVIAYYQDADIFVLPSLRETGGTVLIEAMAYALPIVAFNTSFCTQLNEQNCGIFVNTNQELVGIKNDFCDALVKLSNDRALCKRLGKNGYRYVNDKLTWDEKYNRIVKNM